MVASSRLRLLSDAHELADRLLASHRTRLGGLHIDHARRIAAALGSAESHVVVAALLHDVVEKTTVSAAELRELVGDDRVTALVATLTKRDGESEYEYLLRCARDPVALRIKRLDLADKLTTIDVQVPSEVADRLRTEARDRLTVLNALAREVRRCRVSPGPVRRT